ncbi:MAG TPA: DUF559 domain-containing protein [Puia sp.]|jgi:very-short-patch-repair endonuclease|nr:DUF559 domain-containing protein [Puia sp.]
MDYYKQRNQSYKCLECDCVIILAEAKYSKLNFGIALCRSCQIKFKNLKRPPTQEAKLLFEALRKRGVPAEIEKFDGFKRIDIAITEAKVNIEVDGCHHNLSPKQAISDLYRTYFSFKKGYLTLRIPNSLIKDNLEQTADLITRFVSESRDQLYEDDY